jgi:probable HAF family extracellular repeat protein
MLALSSLLLDVVLAAGAAPAAGQPPAPTLRILNETRSPAAELAQTGLAARAFDTATPEYVPVAIEPAAGHTRSRAYGINDLGQVAGRVSNWDEANQLTVDRNAFFWDPVSGLQLLPGLGGESGAWGLNNQGQASGWSYLSSDPAAFERAVRWEMTAIPITVTGLGTLANTDGVSGDNSTAYDLNDDGAVTGYSDIPNLAGDFTPFHAILYTDGGGLQDLGTFDTLYPYYQNGYSISYDANTAGQVVGLAHNSDWYFRPFIYDASGGLRQLLIDAAYTANEWYAVAINDSGRIGGHVIAATDRSLPYYWTSETAEPVALAMPAEFPYGEIYGINAAGTMVGIMWNDAGTEHAFVFNTTHGVRDLNDLIDPAAGSVLEFARDINASGQIVGSGTKDGVERGFLLTPFEPLLLTVVVDGADGAQGTVDAVPDSSGWSSVRCEFPGTSPGAVTCTGAYPAGTLVELFATPGPGSAFVGWSDGCSGTGDCSVTLSEPLTVSATFAPLVTLAVSRSGLGTGTVTSTPSGIDCGSTCSASFPSGTEVTLTATPGANTVFAGWTGACSGTGSCVVTMSAAASVGARFDLGGSCVITVSDQTVSGAASYQACYAILAGPALAVVAPDGNLNLRANTMVALRNGVSVGAGARLTIALGGVAGGS